MKKILILILFLLFSCEDDGMSPNFGCMNEVAGHVIMENYNQCIQDLKMIK